jgi:hypothetical protein
VVPGPWCPEDLGMLSSRGAVYFKLIAKRMGCEGYPGLVREKMRIGPGGGLHLIHEKADFSYPGFRFKSSTGISASSAVSIDAAGTKI